ncbi:uncharacterized protein LOC102679711 [Apis dorsata]|uniref:uncharacterized protein LOC102679711 n=1 Tax=Apis dorsata TaxID=7462 RepID=UPI0003DF74CA|nr:uncharacterized protein LOC102679711 [Apis dorsata]
MKLFIFFCLLVTLCAAQWPGNSLQQASEAVKKAKNSVQTILSDLNRSKSSIRRDAEQKIYSYQTQSINQMLNNKNFILNYIKKKREEANESGKNADNCLDAVTNKVNNAYQKEYNSLNQCKNQAMQSIEAELQVLDAQEIVGKNLLNELDRVVLDCYNSNTMQMASCIFIKVGYINQRIRQYEQEISQAKRQIQNNQLKILSMQASCNSNAQSRLQNVTSQAIYDTTDCLKD